MKVLQKLWQILGVKRYQVCYELVSKTGFKKTFKSNNNLSKSTAEYIVAEMSIRFPQDKYWYEEIK